MKCVYSDCKDKVEYIYLGQSLCEFHFKKEAREESERLYREKKLNKKEH